MGILRVHTINFVVWADFVCTRINFETLDSLGDSFNLAEVAICLGGPLRRHPAIFRAFLTLDCYKRNNVSCCFIRFLFKKEGPNQGRLFYCCPNEIENACEFFEWKPVENSTPVYKIGGLFNSPQGLYQYMVADTGETFASRKTDSKEAYEVFLDQKYVDSLTQDMERLDIC